MIFKLLYSDMSNDSLLPRDIHTIAFNNINYV